MNPIRITHIITGLEIGGAEKVLTRLLSDMDSDMFENRVISLTGLGPLGQQIEEAGIKVTAMEFIKNEYNLSPLVRLSLALHAYTPHIVQTWMYHADLIGGVAAQLSTHAPVLWNLRQSTLDKINSKRTTINTARICSKLSHMVPNTIVCGSEAARIIHTEMGYDSQKMVVIQNGFDTASFAPSHEKRTAFRSGLGLEDDTILIGNPSRFDPQKDHLTFIAAAAKVAEKNTNVRFVLCGDQITPDNTQLMTWLRDHSLESRTHVLGLLENIAEFYAAMDIVALSSAYGEGAPNVLGESMASGTPCVATDVGDSSAIIGNTGIATPSRNPDAFAEALIALASETHEQRHKRGEAARAHIKNTFPLDTMVQRYQDLYHRVYSQRYDF